MTGRKEYAVLHFFEQGEQCYKINDVAEGESVLEAMKSVDRLEKKRVFLWFAKLVEQILLYHKCIKAAYGYVNPYAIIITENDNIMLLDVEARENKDILKKMQKKSFQSIFTRSMENEGQSYGEDDDLFGFGKLLLFVMEKGSFTSKFTIVEQYKLKNIIKNCVEAKSDVHKKWKTFQRKFYRMSQGKLVSLRVIFSVLVSGILLVLLILSGKAVKKEEPVIENLEEISSEEENLEVEKLYLELGMLRYCEGKDLAGTEEILYKICEESLAAQLYLEIFEYMENGNGLQDEQWNFLWEQLVSEWQRLGTVKKLCYQIPLLDAGKIKNTQESWNVVKNVGEYALQNKLWNGIENDKGMEFQICQFLGNAYQVLNMEEEEQQTYERWKILLQEEEGLSYSIWYETWKEQYETDQEDMSEEEVAEEMEESSEEMVP